MDNTEEKLPPISFRNKTKSNPYAPLIYALVLSFGVMLGFVVNSVTQGKRTILLNNYNKIDEVLNYVDARYVDPVNRTQLTDKTIDKLLSNLDPHSVYIPPKDVSEMNESLEGNFEGIGIEFSIVQDTITVVTAISGGPSEAVGIKAGDRIIKINDSTVAGIKIKDTEVKQKLRGQKGTKVKVGVLRGNNEKLIDFEIKRDKIPLYSVDASFMLNDEVGYIRIGTFSSTTHKEFLQKFNELKNTGLKKLVLDLRGNPGGYLQAATAIADEFISGKKLLVYTKGKSFQRQDYLAGREGVFEKGDLCVLIDEGSASASEILSGAMQDWDRGTVLGRTSFGKGLVQEQYELRDGSALRLTVARYYTPSGRCIQRSYENGTDEYYSEVSKRFLNGYLDEDSIHGSDTTVYKTSKGRKVYGGGGIHPDIFVPIDTSSENIRLASVLAYVREFVYSYTSHHSDFLEKYKSKEDFRNNFSVSEELLNEFYAFTEKKGRKNGNDNNAAVNAKLKLYLTAFFARQRWQQDGYHYITSIEDSVIKAALTSLN